MTDTSKLLTEAGAISSSSPVIKAAVTDLARNVVDLAARVASLEKQLLASSTPVSVPSTGYPKQGISVPLYKFTIHKPQFLTLCKQLAGGNPFALRTDFWPGDPNWATLVPDAAAYGLTVLPICSFAWGAPDAPSLATYTQGAAEAAKLTGWLNLLNEPNLNHWSAQDAAAYVNSAYKAAHLANPNVKVIGPDIAWNDTHSPADAVQWLKDFKAAGGLVDILAVNLYDAPPKGLWAYVDQIKAIYPGLPLFSLESGYWDAASQDYTVSVVNAAMDARDAGVVQSIHYYSLFNDAFPGGYGLLDDNLVPRKAFAALQSRTRP